MSDSEIVQIALGAAEMADAALVVDARGMRCPWPVLRLARAMRAAPSALLIADDPQAEREVRALAAEQGWHMATTGEGWLVSRA